MKRIMLLVMVCLIAFTAFAEENQEVTTLPDVIVTDTQLYPGSYQSIKSDKVKDSTSTDLISVIKSQVPSFYSPSNRAMGYGVARSGAATMSIRGIGKSGWGPTTGIPVLVNGIDTTMGIMGHPVADVLTMKNVEQIEVLIGPQPVLFGSSAMGGVINIITKKQKADGFTTDIQGSYGMWNTTEDYLYHMGKLGSLDYSVGYQFQHTDGDWEQTINGKNFTSEYTQHSGNVHVGYAISKNWYASVESYGMKQNIHDPGPQGISALAPTPLTNQLNLLEEFTIQRGGVAAKISHDYRDFSGSLQAEGNFGHHESVQTNTGNDIFESDDKSYALRLKEIVRPWTGGTLTAGAEWRRWGGTAKNVSTGAYYIDDEYIYDTAVYGLLQQNFLKDMISANAGARYTHNSEYGGFTAWQAGAAVRPFEKTKVYTNIAKGFKLPDIRQYFVKMYPATNTILETGTDLKPETYTSAEVGITQELLDRISVNIAGFRIYSKDQFVYQNNAWTNAPDFNYNGAEAGVTVKAFEWLSVSAGYSYIANKQDDAYLAYVPKHRATGGFVFSMAGVRIQLDGEYVKNLYADTAGTKEFDAYFVANARVSYTLWEKYTAFANFYNITDREYSTFAVQVPPLGNSYCEYPMPGFHFIAGLSATF